ncbi:DUF2927 domain-containing protein [Roseovarius salis]|uniref:DUF2927 domain-containing protein n=1 Tax=Roseovarius salis TaxID=3376063 RepID=UPI0037CA760F
MPRAVISSRVAAGLCALTLLAACIAPSPPGKPRARPPGLDTETAYEPSANSAALTRHYERLQSHLLAQGLLRTGGGGVDTPYTTEDIARNFERIAFYDEYVRGGGLRVSDYGPGTLRRWGGPVRMRLEFGKRVPQEVRDTDAPIVAAYARRLSEVTGHPVTMSRRTPNFHVIISSEDDRERTVARVRELAPGIGPATMGLVRNPPRSIYCMVLTFVGTGNPNVYNKAIALIRSEQPDLMRRSCIHEELAQGLGLGNDSAMARPSIFNDDEEFALLTTHDEELLRLLYHPNLTPGMSLGQARPLIRRILDGQPGPI